MIPHVFIVELKNELNKEIFESLLRITDDEKKTRVERMKSSKDRDSMLVGDVLARYAINRVFGVNLRDIYFHIGEYGKPEITDYPGVFFNISHSGDFVACAVHDQPIGIDIQIIKNINYGRIAKRAYTKIEQELLFSVPVDSRLNQFYKIWTQKESYLKYLGIGFTDRNVAVSDKVQINTYQTECYFLSICF